MHGFVPSEFLEEIKQVRGQRISSNDGSVIFSYVQEVHLECFLKT